MLKDEKELEGGYFRHRQKHVLGNSPENVHVFSKSQLVFTYLENKQEW